MVSSKSAAVRERSMGRSLFAGAIALFAGFPAQAAETTIVSWNMAPRLLEGLERRVDDIRVMDAVLKPDVLVLIEVAGQMEAKRIAEILGWQTYFGVVTNWSLMTTQVNFAIETAVISKIPIERVIEMDASPDSVHPAFGTGGEDNAGIPVSEVELSATGIPGVNPLARTDRGTMRVDLANGLTIFPVHLKSNLNSSCALADSVREGLEDLGLDVPPEVIGLYERGSDRAGDDHRLNAIKRERVVAATKVAADAAVAEGRRVLIAGDFNTAVEPGKAGSTFADCDLQPFSCEPAPFPASACSTGDGFDDTLAILEEPLVGETIWRVLTRDLPRTYNDEAYADRAIDHFAVPADQAMHYSGVARGPDSFGSDHFPIVVVMD
jgi:endonuclease/exonuclease/phosphatase family metal-dependent hydrolase